MSEGKKYKAKPFGPLRQVYNIDINCIEVNTHTHMNTCNTGEI